MVGAPLYPAPIVVNPTVLIPTPSVTIDAVAAAPTP